MRQDFVLLTKPPKMHRDFVICHKTESGLKRPASARYSRNTCLYGQFLICLSEGPNFGVISCFFTCRSKPTGAIIAFSVPPVAGWKLITLLIWPQALWPETSLVVNKYC